MLAPGEFWLETTFLPILAAGMPLVARYHHLKKKDDKGKMVQFRACRAVGLAVELGWRLSSSTSAAQAVTEADLQQVQVGGKIQCFEGGTWQDRQRCSLTLQAQDAKLSLELFHLQRDFLQDVGFIPWKPTQTAGFLGFRRLWTC